MKNVPVSTGVMSRVYVYVCDHQALFRPTRNSKMDSAWRGLKSIVPVK
jgi:hypothetical protein